MLSAQTGRACVLRGQLWGSPARPRTGLRLQKKCGTSSLQHSSAQAPRCGRQCLAVSSTLSCLSVSQSQAEVAPCSLEEARASPASTEQSLLPPASRLWPTFLRSNPQAPSPRPIQAGGGRGIGQQSPPGSQLMLVGESPAWALEDITRQHRPLSGDIQPGRGHHRASILLSFWLFSFSFSFLMHGLLCHSPVNNVSVILHLDKCDYLHSKAIKFQSSPTEITSPPLASLSF